MPYIRALLAIGLSAAAVLNMAACRQQAAFASPADIWDGTAWETGVTASPIRFIPHEDDGGGGGETDDGAAFYFFDEDSGGWEHGGADDDGDDGYTGIRVSEITPDFYEDILQKQEQNGDTIGWLHIPNTEINDVILKNPTEETNNYYLNINFDGEPDEDGVFCADRRAQFGEGGREDLSRITALYGHSRDDDPEGTLFSPIKKYRDPEFAGDHPYIFFSTEAENMVWEVFAVFDTTIYLPYIEPDLSDGEFYKMLNTVYASSLYDYYPEITSEDKLLVLSTCTFNVPEHENLPALNDYRFVVMARLVDPDEPAKEQAEFTHKARYSGPDSTLSGAF